MLADSRDEKKRECGWVVIREASKVPQQCLRGTDKKAGSYHGMSTDRRCRRRERSGEKDGRVEGEQGFGRP